MLYCEQRAGAVKYVFHNDLVGQRTNTATLNWVMDNVEDMG